MLVFNNFSIQKVISKFLLKINTEIIAYNFVEKKKNS